MSRHKKIALTTLTSVFAAVFMGEIVVRLSVPEWSDQWKLWRVDALHSVGLYPNVSEKVRGISREFEFHFRTNAQGLRMNYDLEEKKPAGLKRVLFVGDSFTFGYGVNQEENFVARLQEEIDPSHSRFEMVNAGFASGYATDTEFLFTREIGSKWSPDVVVVGVCLGNDFDDVGYNDWTQQKDTLISVAKRKSELPAWQKSSALAGYSIRRLWPQLLSTTRPKRNLGSTTMACDLSAETNRPTPKLSNRLRILAEGWRADAIKHDYKLVFVFIPEREEVQGEISNQELAKMRLVRSHFSAAAFAANAPIWDLTPTLRSESCGHRQKLYFDRDGHWNVEGHAIAAQWLAPKLTPLLR